MCGEFQTIDRFQKRSYSCRKNSRCFVFGKINKIVTMNDGELFSVYKIKCVTTNWFFMQRRLLNSACLLMAMAQAKIAGLTCC